jgi:membrane-associated phospholipid phosphatase
VRIGRSSNYPFVMLVSVIIFSAVLGAKAQTPAASPSPTPRASPTPSLERQFFKNILRDQRAIWTSPSRLDVRDARWLAPLGVATAAFIATDGRTADAMAKFHDQLKASRVVSYVGSDYGAGGIAATFYLVGRTKHNARARETGLLAAEALIDSNIVAIALKEITQRTRPRAKTGRGDFFHGGTSFPSGHSIQAWSVAAVIANEYHDHRVVQISAYALATAVSISRYTGRNHFLSDVLVGSALGYGIGRYVYHAHHLKNSDSDDEEGSRGRSKLWPLIAPQYHSRARDYGVALAWTF